MSYTLETALLLAGSLLLGVIVATIGFLTGAAVAWRFQRQGREGGLLSRQPKGATGSDVPEETT